jgi:hypothetical protein
MFLRCEKGWNNHLLYFKKDFLVRRLRRFFNKKLLSYSHVGYSMSRIYLPQKRIDIAIKI